MTISHPYWFMLIISLQSVAWVYFGRIIERKNSMLGDGISMLDLVALFKAVLDKDLTLQVKILDEQWEDISRPVITTMITTIGSGKITQANDIRLRLFEKNGKA
jgi:pantothenate kinase-related protein Tda10